MKKISKAAAALGEPLQGIHNYHDGTQALDLDAATSNAQCQEIVGEKITKLIRQSQKPLNSFTS